MFKCSNISSSVAGKVRQGTSSCKPHRRFRKDENQVAHSALGNSCPTVLQRRLRNYLMKWRCMHTGVIIIIYSLNALLLLS